MSVSIGSFPRCEKHPVMPKQTLKVQESNQVLRKVPASCATLACPLSDQLAGNSLLFKPLVSNQPHFHEQPPDLKPASSSKTN